MSVAELLMDLAGRGVRLWVEDQRLRLRAPKGVLDAELRATIEQRRGEILSFLQQAAGGGRAVTIDRVDRDGGLPLSFGQERFWFLGQMYPDSAVGNLPNAFWLDGGVDVAALRDAVNDVVARHEVLRTTFALRDERPVQVIADRLAVPMDVVDLRDMPQPERSVEALRLARQEAAAPFDLTRGPLLRLRLLQIEDRRHLFLWTIHHIVSDGWSSMVFLREVQRNYAERVAGGRAVHDPLPIGFADFAAWERGEAHAQAIAPQIDYWRQRLGDPLPPVLALPADRPRAPVVSYRGDYLPLSFPAARRDALYALAKAQGATPFMLVLAVFQVLLYRLSGQHDIAVGTPIAGRNHTEFEDLIGCFINTLVIRNRLDAGERFTDFLARVRQSCVEAYSNQDVPFERLVQELQPQRSTAYAPIFQAMLILHVQDTRKVDAFGDVAVTPQDLHSGTSKFDLTLELRETGDGLDGWFEYNSDLFDAATVAGFGACFGELLEAVVAAPETAVGSLSLLGGAARRRLLEEWNATAQAFAPGRTLLGLLAAQVARSPEAVAVRFGETALSYAELASRSDRLAGHLQGLGVGRGSRVGIFLTRSHGLLIGALGILKAGAAYVPLDPAYPAERLSFMVSDARLDLVLSEAGLRAAVPAGSARVLCLEEVWSAAAPAAVPAVDAVAADDLAYVIYTSGSTGRPKGVEIAHAALANFLQSMAQRPGLGPADRVLAVTTLSFDIAALELYLPLIVGAQVIIAERETAADGLRLAALLPSSGATVMQATPSSWRMLLEAGWRGDGRLRIFSGGEPLARELADRLLACGGELWNLYGPTETTIWSTVARVGAGTGPVAVGRPIANTEIYIVDARLAPVPVGVAGELLIGGAGLARGYLGRPELTAERFVAHPFDATPGARVYRTGDLARYRADGSIEVLGRLDHQVKLRGYRIELGEIEAVLAGDPRVAEAVVVMTAAGDGVSGGHLAAYLVSRDGGAIAVAELRELARRTLPEYMVPSYFVQLDAMPRTANEKVDRKALPAPTAGASPARSYVAPRTPTEETLAGIWSDVLGCARVGVDDDFFDLGGHSLLAVRLFARIENETGHRLPLASLFTASTIATLAAEIDRGQAPAEWGCVVPINARGTRPPLFCVHGEGGEVLFYRELAARLGDDQPLYGLQAYGLDGSSHPDASVEAMAERYVAEVRRYQPAGPYYLAGHCFGAVVAFEMAQQLKAVDEEVALVAMLDGAGPPARRTLADSIGNLVSAFTGDPVGLARYLAVIEAPARLRQLSARLRPNGSDRANWADGEPNQVERALQAVAEAVAQAYENYEPREYDGKVVCFVNSQRALLKFNRWSRLARSGSETLSFEGDPSSTFNEPSVGHLARELRQYMDRLLRGSSA